MLWVSLVDVIVYFIISRYILFDCVKLFRFRLIWKSKEWVYYSV